MRFMTEAPQAPAYSRFTKDDTLDVGLDIFNDPIDGDGTLQETEIANSSELVTMKIVKQLGSSAIFTQMITTDGHVRFINGQI